MLVENVVNSRSIALAASEDASNKIPFLGLNWFPEAKKSGIDLRWIKTHRGVSPSLAPSNFDALPIIRGREGIKIENTEMPFFRESKLVSERDMIDLARIEAETDPYLASALRGIYDDTNALVSSAEVVGERMRMQLLAAAGGHPQIGISADDVNYAYNYDPNNTYSTSNYTALTGTSMWSDTDRATPLDDLATAKRALAANGYDVTIVLMTSKTFGYLRGNAQIKAALLTTNAAGVIFVTDDAVKRVVKDTVGLDIVIYDKTFLNESGNAEKYYPDDQVTLLPAGPLGKTWFGTTPEERTTGQLADVDVTIYGTGIAIATKPEYGPPYKFTTTASEIVLPSYEGMDGTYVIKVNTPASA